MMKRLTMLVAAAAMALTPALAAPAAAKPKNDDVLKFVLGAAALGLILNEVSKNNRDDRRKVERRYDPDPYPGFRRDERRGRRWPTPPQCVETVRTRDGRRDVVSGGCLSDFGLARGLPRSCAFEVRSPWGPRTVYGESCLRREGYRIGQGHHERP